MEFDNENALKVEDVTKILKIGRNAVYEMAKSGELRSYHIGRKLRFTYTDIQDYINNSRHGGSANAPDIAGAPSTFHGDVFRLCGQDPMLDALSSYTERMGARILRSSTNSYDGLHALYKGEADACICNLLDQETGVYNVPFVKRMLPGTNAAVIHLADRIQGFYVHRGNPKAIISWNDLARDDVQFINREQGSGTRLLLDAKFKERGIDPTRVNGYSRVVNNEVALASMIARGVADAAMGKQVTAAMTEGVDFVPVYKESLDMVITEKSMHRDEGKAIVAVLNKGELKRAFAFTCGYNTIRMGQYTFVSG